MKLLSLSSFLLFGLLIWSCHCDPSLIIQNLNSGWQFHQKGNSSYYNASVPGTIHTDLINNKLINDPYYRENINDVQWVENVTWEYVTHFDLSSSSILLNDRIDLVFTGLDTHAIVVLNNKVILNANNQFRTWVVDVKNIIKQRDNTLTITFLPIPLYNEEQMDKLKPLILPSDFDEGRVFTRKAAYHFGWDWGPRLVTVGIWRPVYLQAWNESRIEYLRFQQTMIGKDEANISMSVDLLVNVKQTYGVKVLNSKTGEVYRDFTIPLDRTNQTGVAFQFSIKNPKLWWVRNFGEPYLYPIKVQILAQGRVLDEKEANLGIRTLELIREKDEIGESFYFKINGKKVFAKGGNYIPPDNFLSRVAEKDYKEVIQNAIDANYNFIRVWGGGNYENDIFYDLCDKEGILLWQDFMFAGGMYPGDLDFLSNLSEEIIQNVKRLVNHPSIALWCGNNEIKNAWEDWGYQSNMTEAQRKTVYGWYSKIFLEIIPGILKLIDPSRAYWPSSPSHGFGHPENLIEGDSHYYGVWVSNAPIEDFRTNVGRFMSEYGMQGFPCLNSVKKYTLPRDRYLNSSVILTHEKGTAAYYHIGYYVGAYFRNGTNFENYLYVTQIMQMYAIQTAIEAHRYNKPRNMGTLMWQLNDLWPAFSWSAVDYYGSWKAVQYMIKKKYQDVIVSIAPNLDTENNTQYDIYIVSEKLFDFQGVLSITIMDMNGTKHYNSIDTYTIPSDSSTIYKTIHFDQYKDLNLSTSIIYANLTYDFGEKFSETYGYFDRPRFLELQNPQIKVSVNILRQTVTLTSDTFVLGAYVYVEDIDIHFDDNYFNLLPGVPKTITALRLSSQNFPSFPSVFKVLHLYGSYSKDTHMVSRTIEDDNNASTNLRGGLLKEFIKV